MHIVNDILGWGLLVAGLCLIWLMIYGAGNGMILLSMSLSIPATFVFRAGVSFLKMNSAYRMAQNLRGQRNNDQ